MGLAYTIDSPIRVAHYGISSVISIVDDELIERMNAFYSRKFNLPYQEITQKVQDYRATRITSYLNLVDTLVREKFESFKNELSESRAAVENYIAMLPNRSELKKNLESFIADGRHLGDSIRSFLEKNLRPGSVDVNIMTKVDKDNFDKGKQLPVTFNDAHAALRGFANSNLSSSLVLSAGMNPRLYSYLENFSDFYPSEDFTIRKKIVIKVSDFRSALIQGNFLAKKGLWVSEYRVESGLNCGGHAFASDGSLLGLIMEEFKEKKDELVQSAYALLVKALQQKGLPVPPAPPQLLITVQGGVGTAEEHEFLLDYYNADSVGWGSPFLLVPEATSCDADTRQLLANAGEGDLYLSNISPLGVPFNTVRGTSNEKLRLKRIESGRAGSSCPKKLLALSKEFGEKGICTAARKYQEAKLEAIAANDSLQGEAKRLAQEAITEKSCLCVGLANASYLENGIPVKGEAQGVVVCPGPNIAYFKRQYSLREMTGHIYGNASVLEGVERPHMFIKELSLYLEHLRRESAKQAEGNARQLKKIKDNLISGIAYYRSLFSGTAYFQEQTDKIKASLDDLEFKIGQVGLN